MIHIFFGVSPASIGIAPYRPAFYELDPGQLAAGDFGLDLAGATIQSLPLVSGFLGSDILAAALATDLARQPAATLLIDLGTNGELLLKGHDGYYATSCATGPAFEGASLTCGMQAVAGAVNRIVIDEASAPPRYTVINGNAQDAPRPLGICGSGIVSGVAAMVRTGLVAPSGLLVGGSDKSANHNPGRRYVVVPAERAADGREIAISQKDIRAVQLGKGALLTGIEFLLRAAGLTAPEKVIVAGAFGSYLEPADMLTLGMLPPVAPERIHFAGNSAGAGAIMALCDPSCRTAASELARLVRVVELTANPDFQRAFVERLGFP